MDRAVSRSTELLFLRLEFIVIPQLRTGRGLSEVPICGGQPERASLHASA